MRELLRPSHRIMHTRHPRADPDQDRMGTSTGAFRPGRSTTGFAPFIPGREAEPFFGTRSAESSSRGCAKAKLLECDVREHWYPAQALQNAFSAVVCGDGIVLEILEVQLPNRKPQTGLDFSMASESHPVKYFAMWNEPVG